MITSEQFLDVCKEHQFELFTGTPCSYLKPFINKVIDDSELDFIETTNEGDAVALASGAWLGGQKSVVMFQNSGLGNAVNPITSLSYTMEIPFLGIVTLRGEPGGPKDEPQHKLMGEITIDMLKLMKVGVDYFPTQTEDIAPAFKKAIDYMENERRPFFFVMRKNSVDAYELQTKQKHRSLKKHEGKVENSLNGSIEITKTMAIKEIKKTFPQNAAFIATTGKTGRELFEIEDSANQLYMVGSMGCALPIGLGLRKTNFTGPIGIIDGDGAVLMRLGNLALAGQLKPQSLIHIVLDNGAHDSTGGQRTYSEHTDLSAMAVAAGYERIYETDSLESFNKAIKNSLDDKKLTFIRLLIKPGSPKDLGRPTVTPAEVALRLRSFIMESK